METTVETFLQEDVKSLIYEPNDLTRWHNLVKELKLKGQQDVAQPNKSPIPFLRLNSQFVKVFETLCPAVETVENFSFSPIPLEILELISLSTRENYFGQINIWYDDTNPDPVAIGRTGQWAEMVIKTLKEKDFNTRQKVLDAGGQHPHFYTTGYYLIGRWGDVNRSFAELKEMAKARFIKSEQMKWESNLSKVYRQIFDVEVEAFNLFGC